jgi:hypothetical protein
MIPRNGKSCDGGHKEKGMPEWGSLACEIIPAGNLLFSFIMKFFSSVESNSRYAASFDAPATLSVRF